MGQDDNIFEEQTILDQSKLIIENKERIDRQPKRFVACWKTAPKNK